MGSYLLRVCLRDIRALSIRFHSHGVLRGTALLPSFLRLRLSKNILDILTLGVDAMIQLHILMLK